MPHQLFATAGFASALMRGMVGLEETDRGLRLAPQLPPGWHHLRLRNLRWRGAAADVEIRREAERVVATMKPRKGEMSVEVVVSLPPGAELVSKSAALTLRPGTPTGEVRMRPGIELTVDQKPLTSGDESRRLRIVETRRRRRQQLPRASPSQGRRGQTYRLSLDAPFEVLGIEGGKELPREAGLRRIEVTIPRGDREWIDTTLTVKLGKRVK